MNAAYKPDGYNSLSPCLVIDGAQRFIDFTASLFGASVVRRFDLPDDTIMHAEIRIDETILMLGDAGEGHAPNTTLLHLYVPDVDSTFERALELGCVALEQPNQRDGDPDRRGSFRDFAGNVWAVGTQMRAMPG